MTASTSIRLKGQLRIDIASQFGPMNEAATVVFEMVAPARVTGEGAIATIHVDERDIKAELRAAAAAFSVVVGSTAEARTDDLATFCKDVLEVELHPWQIRLLNEWTRGVRPTHRAV